MITKERVEQTIRGVIGDFKRRNRIPDAAADELNIELEARVDQLFEEEASLNYTKISDSAEYVQQLRTEAESIPPGKFLQEIIEWQELHSS